MIWAFRKRSRLGWFLPVLLPLLALLPGCGGDVYSESLTYPLRTDPIILDAGGKEYQEPDRPGQLPLLNVKDAEDTRNPFFDFFKDPGNSGKYIDPTRMSAEAQQELREALEDLFGTPAHPKVDGISAESREILQLQQQTLEEGSRLYRLHCVQCHGLTGDGRGPTAKWVNPHPRDYRKGLFKFQSVDQADDDKFFPPRKGAPPSDDQTRPPRREDLIRTLQEGVEGTAMQSYNMLPEADLNPIISYVIHLSIRGQVEEQVLIQAKGAADPEKGPFDITFKSKGGLMGLLRGKRGAGGEVRKIVDSWRDAQEDYRKIRVGPYKFKDPTDPSAKPEDLKAFQDSVQSGYEIFLGRGPVSGGCTQCHYDFGRKALFKFDSWGTMVRPRELNKGHFRGGRRPVDIYYRIQSGINGSAMLKQGGSLSPDQIWDVVNFVRALPYPAMRQNLQPPLE